MTYPTDWVGAAAPPPLAPTPREIAAARAQQLEAASLRGGPSRDQLRAALPPYRNAVGIDVLFWEADQASAGRDRASDGTIGDVRHLTAAWGSSDHQPWLQWQGMGIVRAADIDVDGLDLAASFELARAKARAGHLRQLIDGGYLILNRRISAEDWSGWRNYTGPNPHTAHGHVSLSRDPVSFDSAQHWGIFDGALQPAPAVVPPPAPAPAPAPPPPPPVDVRWLQEGPGHYPPHDPRHGATATLQSRLRTRFPLYAKRLATDGWFGPATAAAVREFQRRSPGLVSDGIAGPATLSRLGL